MPLRVVCDEEHSLLADPWVRGEPGDVVGPCCVCGAVARLREEPALGRGVPRLEIPGYDVLGPLHGGVMAGVYKARHVQGGRPVVVKVNHPNPDEPAADRGLILREARTLGVLDHPNVVRLLEAGEAGGLAYFSTEWHPGGTLAERVSEGPLPPIEAVLMAAKLADAAHHAHGRRVVHRDIRPSNVVFDKLDEPVLVDFGIAKRLDRPHGTTRNGAMSGDPRYMAPEQWSDGPRRVGPAVDVHGIGAVLYQALTGRLPFEAACLLERLGQDHVLVPPPTALRPSLPPALDRICLRSLSPVSGERYATAGELADELRGVLVRGGR